MPRLLKTLAELGRISNLPTVWTNLAAGWVLGGGGVALGSGYDFRLFWLCAGGSLVYFAGMALNDAADARWDREHGKDRPIPRGDVSALAVWLLSGAALLLGSVLMISLGGAKPLWVGLLAASLVIYDLYHKPWAGSVIFMAGCRVFLLLSAASVVASEISQTTLLRALCLGSYVIGLTLLARGENGGDRRWSTFGTFLLAAPLALTISELPPLRGAAVITPILVLIAALAWLLPVVFGKTLPFPKRIGSLLAGLALVDALAVATREPYLALLFVLLTPVLLLWQRWVAAT